MGLFTNYLDRTQYINLATSIEKEMEQKKEIQRPRSIDNKSTSNENTKKIIYELSTKDWFTFATINVCSITFSRPKFKIISTNQKAINEWNTFFDKITMYGTNTSLRRLRSEVKRDAITYGAGYLEYVYDQTGRYILDLKRVDAAKIEHAKDRYGNLIMNNLGLSIGYVLHLGADKDPRSKGDPVPYEYTDRIRLNNGDVFIDPLRIAEFPLIKSGNDTEAIGLIEPAILQAQRRMKLETAQVNALWIRGTAPIFTYVGDTTHEPTPQMMDDAVDAITELKSSQAMAFPYYNKVDSIKIEMDDSMKDVMNSLMFGQAGASGAPLPFVTSQGEATNRSTLATQKVMFESNIQSFVDNFDEDWNNQVMKRVSEVNGLREAKIVSERLDIGDKLEFSTRISKYIDLNLISKKEARNALFRIEDIERDDESYEKELTEKVIQEKETLQDINEENSLKKKDRKVDELKNVNNMEEGNKN